MLPIDESLRIDAPAAAKYGALFADAYRDGKPYPYICIDDFLPASIAERALNEFPTSAPAAESFNRAQERLKRSFDPEVMADFPRRLFYTFNSLPFIKFLEALTGIKSLIPDPYFLGGGFHEVMNGGHLDIHADFNLHKPMKLERRINALIYLNKDWRSEYGGQFEIWDKAMSKREHTFDPVFNRCVIFNTASDSYHGNPAPVHHPKAVSRKSIALYYYTATWDAATRSHTTQFQRRPGTADRFDYYVRAKELVAELTPPIVYRNLIRFAKTLRGH